MTETQTLPKQDNETLPAVRDETPMERMINLALSKDTDPSVIGQILTYQERYQASQARMAFGAAMAAARREIPTIAKKRTVDFTSAKGRTNYQYEEFADITEAVVDILGKHGLFFRFNTDQAPDKVMVTCIIEHELGHSERNTLWAPVDMSGNKNPLQGIGSSVTYLQRYTLKAALGLAAAKDDDGAGAGVGTECIDSEQVRTLDTLLKESNTPLAKFLLWAGVHKDGGLPDVPAAKYDEAISLLEQKKRQLAAAAEAEAAAEAGAAGTGAAS